MKIRRNEMSIEIYGAISLICFCVFGVLLLVSAILFWKLNIRKVYEELTGAAARKAIEELKGRENVYSKTNLRLQKVRFYNKPENSVKNENVTEKLMDAEIEDETKLLEEFSYIPKKRENAVFEITKDEIYIHEEEATELLEE